MRIEALLEFLHAKQLLLDDPAAQFDLVAAGICQRMFVQRPPRRSAFVRSPEHRMDTVTSRFDDLATRRFDCATQERVVATQRRLASPLVAPSTAASSPRDR